MVQLDTHPPNLTHDLNISQSNLGANHMYPVQALFTLAIFSSNFSLNFVRRQVALNLNKNNSPWIGINMLCNVFFTEEAFHEASEILKITAALQQILWRIVREANLQELVRNGRSRATCLARWHSFNGGQSVAKLLSLISSYTFWKSIPIVAVFHRIDSNELL